MLHLTLIALFSISLGVTVLITALIIINATVILIKTIKHNRSITIQFIAIAGPMTITALLYQLSLIY